jgi:hypothetical protein
MRIASNGNVGIGTTSPSTKFVVSNAGASGFEVDPIGGVSSGVLLQAYNRSTSAYMAQSYYALSHTFNVGSGGGTRAVDINSNGSVGIGTTSPIKTLQINATTASIRLEENSASAKRLELSIDSSAVARISANQSGQSIAFETVGSERLRIAADGNVGIGTTSPGYKLDVVQTTNDTYIRAKTTTAGAYFSADSATDGYYGYSLYNGSTEKWFIGGYGSADLGFSLSKGGTQYMTILRGNGNVGIGTTSPGYKLEVAGDGRFVKSTDQIIKIETTSGTDNARVDFITPSKSYTIQNLQTGAANALIFYDLSASAERMRISSAGSVGIGTTSPTTTLHVAGSARVTTTFTLDATLTDYSSVASSIAGANNLFTQATGSYTSAFFKYTVTNGVNARSGEVMAVWNGGSAQYTDNSTLDIGSTTAVTASVSIVGGDVQFNIQTNTSGWSLKSLATFM